MPKVQPSVLARSSSEHRAFFQKVTAGDRVIIELHSGIGRITDLLVENVNVVYAVDHWQDDDVFDTFCVNNWDNRLKIMPIFGLSNIVMPWLKEKEIKPQIIYINFKDSKTFASDLEVASLIFPDAWIMGDNYRGGDMSVYMGLQNQNHYQIQEHPGGMWLGTKKKENAGVN